MEDDAGDSEGILLARLFMSDEKQGLSATIATLQNSLALQGVPGHGSRFSTEIKPGYCSGIIAPGAVKLH